MGNGNWATDPGLLQKVLTVYFQMVSFAAKRSDVVPRVRRRRGRGRDLPRGSAADGGA